MELEQVNKVAKLNEDLLENEEEVKVDDERIYKLSAELLTKILDYLDEKELVKCRLVTTRWNEICCLLLQEKTRKNPNSKLMVHFNNIECKTVITKSLQDFLDCFTMKEAEKSIGSGRRRPFPFSCFKIAGLFFMDRNQMTQFVSLFVHIKKLCLDVNQADLRNFGTFWRLLLKFAPNIEHLGLIGNQWCTVELFDPYLNVKANYDPFQNLSASEKCQIQHESFLNKLKVVEILPFYCSSFVNPIDNFLEHTPNVQQLLNNDPLYLLGVWQRFNRAHLLKKLEIGCNSQSCLSPVELVKNLQLEELTADCRIVLHTIEKLTINYIHHALKSSQDTLSKLNLWNLTMESMNFCVRDIKSLPNVRHLQLQIQNAMETGNILERLGQLCPNTTKLDVGLLYGDFSQVALILWTKFTGLKSLKFRQYVNFGQNNSLSIDSAISGYSQESIGKIQAKLDQGILLEEARRGEEQNPSILDLKDLSRLELRFFVRKRGDETEKLQKQLWNSVFMKMLPQHIREYPTSFSCAYTF